MGKDLAIMAIFSLLLFSNISVDSPPKVEILSPVNNSIIYDKFANFSIKCYDDTYVTSLHIQYSSEYEGVGVIGIGLRNKTFFFNYTHFAFPGYNWIVATAYDEFANYGQNISIYYYETPEKPYPKGEPPIVRIISPSNGDVVYSRDVKIIIECKSNENIVAVDYAWGGKYGSGGGSQRVYPPSNNYSFYFFPYRLCPGYNWVYVFAYSENGSIGYDNIVYYYNTSKDIYPPEIEIRWPPTGKLILFNREICRLPYNFSIVIGNFKFFASVEDYEEHLQKIQLYLDNRLIIEKESDGVFDTIYWDSNRLLLGWHILRVVAIDSFNNSAEKQRNYFIINFL